MRHKKLHDMAKFGAGLIAGDFLVLTWIAQANILPVDFFGRVISSEILAPALIFDAAIFMLLVHYGWNLGKIPVLREKGYLLITGTVFSVVALAHLVRLFANAEVSIAGFMLPLWLSWVGTAVTT